jgi:hypothetical protein
VIAAVNALTDDKSVTVPTAWWLYTNASESYVNDRLDENKARPTDLEIHGITASGPHFTVVMVPDSGAYAVPGWLWYYGLTYQGVIDRINQTNGRLIDVEPYWDGGALRYAIIVVSNTGSDAKIWWRSVNGSLGQQECGTSQRTFHVSARETVNYDVIRVANTLPAGQSWCYYKGLTSTRQIFDIAGYQKMRVIDVDTYTMTYTTNVGTTWS